MESATYTVLSNGVHTDSTTGVRYKVKSGEVITMQRAVNLGLPGAAAVPSAKAETQSRTATTDGSGAGTIVSPASGSVFVEVTSDSAAKKVILPDATPGTSVSLRNGATGYVLDGGDSTVNGFSSISVPANTLVECRRDTSGTWIARTSNVGGSILGPNLFENGSFEVGAINWTPWSEAEGETIEIVSVGVISGGGSLQVTTPGDENQEGVAYNAFFLVDPGQSYRLAFTIKGDLNVRIQLRPGSVPLEKVTWDRVLTSTPETVVFDFLAAATVGNARFEVFTNSGAPQEGAFVLDDLSFREILA